MKHVMIAVLGFLALTMGMGCETGGGGSDHDNSANNVPNVAGTWKLTDLTFGKNATVNLTQDGQILAGTVDNFNGRHGVVQGTITSAGHLELRLIYPKAQTDLTAQVSGTTLSGTWVDHRDGTVAQISGVKL
jgi:hypothetical protein